MGLAFIEKIRSLVELHDKEWISSADLTSRIFEKPYPEGFYYIDQEGEPHVVSTSTVARAVQDCAFWRLIETRRAGNRRLSRLSTFGIRSRDGDSFSSEHFESVLTDILFAITRVWEGDEKALDLEKLLTLISEVPKDIIPTHVALYNSISAKQPNPLGRLKGNRFKQLLDLLGPRGTADLVTTRKKLHFADDDPRIEKLG